MQPCVSCGVWERERQLARAITPYGSYVVSSCALFWEVSIHATDTVSVLQTHSQYAYRLSTMVVTSGHKSGTTQSKVCSHGLPHTL